MATKLSIKDTKSFLEGGFFNNWTVTQSVDKSEIGLKLNDEKGELKVKVKFRDPRDKKVECIGVVVDVTATEQLRVLEDRPDGTVSVHLLKPLDVIGVFFVSLGREIEINFGVGKSSITSLVDEY